MYTPLKNIPKWVLGVSGLTLLILLGAVVDIATPYETTPEQTNRALLHLSENSLPTPTNAFSHDGCSLFPDRILKHDLRAACLEHDIVYWAGGTKKQRREADLALRDNIRHTGPLGPLLAPPMYYSVRLFGDSWLTRLIGANWGYGYNS